MNKLIDDKVSIAKCYLQIVSGAYVGFYHRVHSVFPAYLKKAYNCN